MNKKLTTDSSMGKSESGRKKLDDINRINMTNSIGLLISFTLIVVLSIIRAAVRKN